MQAKVTKQFDGVENGAIYPRRYAVGEVISGRLAEVAIAEKWAEPVGIEPSNPPSSVSIPDDWETFNAADSVALARALGADDGVKTKAAAVEFIAAEVEKRAAEAQG